MGTGKSSQREQGIMLWLFVSMFAVLCKIVGGNGHQQGESSQIEGDYTEKELEIIFQRVREKFPQARPGSFPTMPQTLPISTDGDVFSLLTQRG
jgi:hypothetical protein